MNITLTETQKAGMQAIFNAIHTLADDKDFMKKLMTAYDLKDEHITDENEEDYMNLMNFIDNVRDQMRENFG